MKKSNNMVKLFALGLVVHLGSVSQAQAGTNANVGFSRTTIAVGNMTTDAKLKFSPEKQTDKEERGRRGSKS